LQSPAALILNLQAKRETAPLHTLGNTLQGVVGQIPEIGNRLLALVVIAILAHSTDPRLLDATTFNH
jgi:hypothetical protein